MMESGQLPVEWQLLGCKTNWDLLGQRDLSLAEAFSVIGREIGKLEPKYVRFSDEDAGKWMRGMGISSDITRLLIELSHVLNEGLFGVNQFRTADNTTTTSIEEFAVVFAEAFAAPPFRQAA